MKVQAIEKQPAQLTVDKVRLDQLVADAKNKVRAILYQERDWYMGTDVCKALGLAPTPSRKSYQSVFDRLASFERTTLPENLGGRGHNRVMVNAAGLCTLAHIALERETTAAIRETCLQQQQEAEKRPVHLQHQGVSQ